MYLRCYTNHHKSCKISTCSLLGDVIVEINGEDMEPKDHAQLVNIIKNSEKELL